MTSNNRLGGSGLMPESLYKTLVSCAVRKVALHYDLTDQDLADKIASSAATIGNARNLNGYKLQAHTLFNLLVVDPLALEGMLNFYGRRSVPIEAKCDTDELVSTSGAVHKLAAVKSPASPGGAKITDDECVEIEPEIDAAIEALCALKSRAEDIRRKRA